jgi:hypothetical protein
VLFLAGEEPSGESPVEVAMNTRSNGTRALALLLLIALSTAALAPAAAADHRQVRYKRISRGYGPRVVRVIHGGPMIIERHSDFGAVAGFLGGLVVGSVLSNAPPPPPVYEYFDPYCHQRFATVVAYDDHLYRHRHPRRLEVIEVHSGRCVDTWDWRDGRWCGQDDRDPRDEEWDD